MPGIPAGGAVSKEALIKTVWPDTFVSDDVLTRSVSRLRRVLEDDAREPQFLETIPKRGYRLVAPVAPMNGGAHGTPVAIASANDRSGGRAYPRFQQLPPN